MTLHPVLEEKLNTALAPAAVQTSTRRDASLPSLPNKAHAVTGMRRSGKTTFLKQLATERQCAASSERGVYISLDDDRLSETGLQLFAYKTRTDVDGASGGIGNDDLDRPVRIRRRLRRRG